MSLYTADFGATEAMTGATIERSFLAVEDRLETSANAALF